MEEVGNEIIFGGSQFEFFAAPGHYAPAVADINLPESHDSPDIGLGAAQYGADTRQRLPGAEGLDD